MNEKIEVHEYESRDEYKQVQIIRSQRKLEYCKVYFQDAFRYRDILRWDYFKQQGYTNKYIGWNPGTILCLGVRSGAENDIFRTAFFSPFANTEWFQNRLIKKDTGNLAAPKIELAKRYGLGSGTPGDGRVVGVEINPDANRPDIHVGSFDELPEEWTDSFDILFTNSFDHAMDPAHTVREWKRVLKPGGYMILCFALGQVQSEHDPVVGLSFNTLAALWNAPIVFSSQTQNKNGYHEICFRIE